MPVLCTVEGCRKHGLDPARVLAVLREVEWAAAGYCPRCAGGIAIHAPDCELAALKAKCEALT